MRISTAWLFSSGAATISRKQAEMAKSQEQLSSGKRVLTPSDDPIAASNALTAEQSRALAEQYLRNQGMAQSSLGLAESALGQVGDVLQQARTLVVSAGNGSLGPKDRASLAQELRGTLETLLSLANTGDGAGGFLFSGYQDSVQPFVHGASGIAYQGDQGSRTLQVGAQRFLQVSASGSDVFEGSRAGNGSFTVTAGAGNGGSATADAGRVISPAALTGHSYSIVFSTGGAGVTYDVVDTTTAVSLVSSAPWTPGSAITVDGMQVTITGAPTGNDRFDLAPSVRQSMFKTLEDMAALLESSARGGVREPAFQTGRLSGLAAIDGALDQALSVRAQAGTRLRELDTLGSMATEQSIARQQELSRLVDLDYADAISRLAQQQASLDASQKSYLRVTGLSLFNLL
jgi:flagellar hook-associated protein 3 FlgL